MPTVEDIDAQNAAEGDTSSAPKHSPPVLHPVKNPEVEDLDEEDDIDETVMERLAGLTEMFPESVRNLSSGAFTMSIGATKWLYAISRVGLWVAASSATILALPVMFETERSQMEEQQLAQQRQILLGPNAAVSGGAPGMPPVGPPTR